MSDKDESKTVLNQIMNECIEDMTMATRPPLATQPDLKELETELAQARADLERAQKENAELRAILKG